MDGIPDQRTKKDEERKQRQTMVLRVVGRQGEPVSSGAQQVQSGPDTEGSRRRRRSGVAGGRVVVVMVRVDTEERRGAGPRLCGRRPDTRQVVPVRSWQRVDAEVEKCLTRGTADQGVDAYFPLELGLHFDHRLKSAPSQRSRWTDEQKADDCKSVRRGFHTKPPTDLNEMLEIP